MKTFKVEIGDLFGEGHKILKSVFVQSDTNLEQIRDAFIKSAASMGLFDESKNVFNICDEWREYNMSYDVVKILVDNKVDLKNVIQDYDLEEIENFYDLEKDFYCEFEWNQKSKEKAMVTLIMNIAKKVLDFDYKISKEEKIMSFNKGKKGKFNVGYGMMD